MNRRNFIKSGLALSPFVFSSNLLLAEFSKKQSFKLVILHTNDIHSRVDPFPETDTRNAGNGGLINLSGLVKKIRQENTHVLLLDCGDIFQGTPYFNYFKGSVELDIMNQMGYDCGTIGNHEFDNGSEELSKMLPKAKFPFVCCNYDLSKSPLKNIVNNDPIVKTFMQHNRKVSVGIIGVGIELEGLVTKKNYGEITYLDPISSVNKQADWLKNKRGCDLVIVISHLGFGYKTNKISDKVLAKNSKHVDIILGGHTHTFLNEPISVYNSENKPVTINQCGWAGLKLGRIDIVI